MKNIITRIKSVLKNNDSNPHIFLHLHKSGGTSLMNCIDANYANSNVYVINGKDYRNSYNKFKNESISNRKKIDLLRGHHFFGSHDYLRNDAVYFTMLREPISRLCSLYNFLIEINLYQEINKNDMSFGDFLESGLAMAADNGMTRMLTNNDFDKIPNGKININLAEEAINNIKEKFIAVGLTEEFDASLKLFKEKLNWTIIPKYSFDNRTAQKYISYKDAYNFFEANEEKKRFIDADLKVYRYAKEKFLKDKVKYLE